MGIVRCPHQGWVAHSRACTLISRCPFLISTGPAAMKHKKSALLCLALLILIVTEAVPAKGGSKSMMKNRGGSKGSGSRGSGRSNHPSGDDNDDGLSGSGIKTDKPPCVGLCYYNKLHGLPIETTTPRQPCIGLCYLNKLRLSKGLAGIKWRRG